MIFRLFAKKTSKEDYRRNRTLKAGSMYGSGGVLDWYLFAI